MHLNTLKTLNHIQTSILRGETKNLLLPLRAEGIIFFAWEFVLSASTKASLNNNNKLISKLEEGWAENYSPHLIKVMSESLEIIQGLSLMQLGCCRPLAQGSEGRNREFFSFFSSWALLTDLGLGQWPQLCHKGELV